jgi:hypothetical protein
MHGSHPLGVDLFVTLLARLGFDVMEGLGGLGTFFRTDNTAGEQESTEARASEDNSNQITHCYVSFGQQQVSSLGSRGPRQNKGTRRMVMG